MPQTENLPNGVISKNNDRLKLKVNRSGQVLAGRWRVIAARQSESLTVPAPLRCSTRTLIARLLSWSTRSVEGNSAREQLRERGSLGLGEALRREPVRQDVLTVVDLRGEVADREGWVTLGEVQGRARPPSVSSLRGRGLLEPMIAPVTSWSAGGSSMPSAM